MRDPEFDESFQSLRVGIRRRRTGLTHRSFVLLHIESRGADLPCGQLSAQKTEPLQVARFDIASGDSDPRTG
jgi:hypothetical protein